MMEYQQLLLNSLPQVEELQPLPAQLEELHTEEPPPISLKPPHLEELKVTPTKPTPFQTVKLTPLLLELPPMEELPHTLFKNQLFHKLHHSRPPKEEMLPTHMFKHHMELKPSPMKPNQLTTVDQSPTSMFQLPTEDLANTPKIP
jgi:hypothetical protein